MGCLFRCVGPMAVMLLLPSVVPVAVLAVPSGSLFAAVAAIRLLLVLSSQALPLWSLVASLLLPSAVVSALACLPSLFVRPAVAGFLCGYLLFVARLLIYINV